MSVKARRVTVTGTRGSITKNLSHLAIDIRVMKKATAKLKGMYVRVLMWNAGYKQACAVTTFKSLISNMIIGVTEVSLYAISSTIPSKNNLLKDNTHVASFLACYLKYFAQFQFK